MKRLFLVACVFLLAAVTSAKSGAADSPKQSKKGCKRACPTPVSGQKPYCGTDGVTYPSKCELNRAKCLLAAKNGTALDSKHRGPCDKKNAKRDKSKILWLRKPKKCPDGSQCKSAANSTKHAVCGSDNVTYPSYCHLRVAGCQALMKNQTLTLLHKRACGKLKVVCPLYGECSKARNFVCGTNGKTYRNSCYFSVAQCRLGKKNESIRIQSRGDCEGGAKRSKSCPRRCPQRSRPVCGTDDRTYANGCELSMAKCQLPAREQGKLKLKYEGACGSPRSKCVLHKCTVKRNKSPTPVCGTDGRTYKSKCHLRAAKCGQKVRRGRPLAIKRWGKCNRKGRKTGRRGSG